jgi:hypothetical protein
VTIEQEFRSALTATALLLLIGGCAPQTEQPNSPSSGSENAATRPDPSVQSRAVPQSSEAIALNSFKAFVAAFDMSIDKLVEPARLLKRPAFDVRRTDSLVSPFVAELTFPYASRSTDDESTLEVDWIVEFHRTVTAHYAYQEDAWNLKSVTLTITDVKFIDGNSDGFLEARAKMIGRTKNLSPAQVGGSDSRFIEALQRVRDTTP